MHQRVSADHRRGTNRRSVLDDLTLQLGHRTRRDEVVAVDKEAVDHFLAQAPGAAASEEVTLNEVYAPGGGVGDVPLSLKIGDSFESVPKAHAPKQCATFVLGQWRKPNHPTHHQLRLRGEKLPDLRDLGIRVTDSGPRRWHPRRDRTAHHTSLRP